MDFTYNGSELNQKTVLGHPSGLYILFFTEMWERFSYYGMRAILVLFLVSSFNDGGWGWDRSEALALYGIYTGLVYITPIFGGLIADKFLGYRNAVIIGAFVMTLGHASMAFEVFNDLFLYLGLIFLIIGNGFFKPNISSIVGQLYKTEGQDKDAGYTIFYMGINSGAFLGILLCGYIGENIGWHYGFGLAGVFMFLGMLQFYYAQKIFGNIGVFENGIYSEKQIDIVFNKVKTLFTPDKYKLIIIPSYRTPEQIIKKAYNTFSHNHLVFKNVDKNAYLSSLSISDFIVVTCDSTSMISESAVTGKPIYVANMPPIRNNNRFKN